MLALSLAALLASTAFAEDAGPPPPRPTLEKKAPLSKEDEELVKELALLEQMELVKNLELFEGEKQPPKESAGK